MEPKKLAAVAARADDAMKAVYDADHTQFDQLVSLRLAALSIAEDDPDESNVLEHADAAALAIRKAAVEP